MKKEFEKEQKDNQIDDMFLDMPDMDDDGKFSQWLEEEYQREADEIEEALFADQKYDENSEIVKKLSVSREDFYQRLREEGLLEEDASAQEKETSEKETSADSEEASGKKVSENDDTSGRVENDGKKILEFRKDAKEDGSATEKVLPFGKETSGKKKHSYVRLGRLAGIAGVCLICVFAASMSSEANRKYLVNSVRILSGNDSQLITDNDGNNEHASTEESDAIADIEEKLGVKMPEFYYRPYGMEFLDYEVDTLTFYAKVEYKYEDSIFTFYIDKESDETTSSVMGSLGEGKEIYNISKENTDIVIKEIQDAKDEIPTFVANWKYNDCVFALNGKIEFDEIKKIIEEIKF